jgi:hypothetical protein
LTLFFMSINLKNLADLEREGAFIEEDGLGSASSIWNDGDGFLLSCIVFPNEDDCFTSIISTMLMVKCKNYEKRLFSSIATIQSCQTHTALIRVGLRR